MKRPWPPRAAWRDDPVFCELAAKHWPEDLALAERGGYDRGAGQKLTYRYQGWLLRRVDSTTCPDASST